MTASWCASSIMCWFIPGYHGRGIAGHLLEMVKEVYKSYLYINVMIGDSKNAPFYEKHGFKIKEDSLPMQYRNVPKYTKDRWSDNLHSN